MIVAKLNRLSRDVAFISGLHGGNLLADEEKLGDFKCEGIEIV